MWPGPGPGSWANSICHWLFSLPLSLERSEFVGFCFIPLRQKAEYERWEGCSGSLYVWALRMDQAWGCPSRCSLCFPSADPDKSPQRNNQQMSPEAATEGPGAFLTLSHLLMQLGLGVFFTFFKINKSTFLITFYHIKKKKTKIVWGQYRLQSKFQDSQDCIAKPSMEKS